VSLDATSRGRSRPSPLLPKFVKCTSEDKDASCRQYSIVSRYLGVSRNSVFSAKVFRSFIIFFSCATAGLQISIPARTTSRISRRLGFDFIDFHRNALRSVHRAFDL